MKYENEIREIIQKLLEEGADQFYIDARDGSLSWHGGETLKLSADTISEICSEMVNAGLAQKNNVSIAADYYELTPMAEEF